MPIPSPNVRGSHARRLRINVSIRPSSHRRLWALVDIFLSRSFIHRVWALILLSPLDPNVQALKALVSNYLDRLEHLQPFGFTPVHQSVLGLSPIDLSVQLQTSTADIDTCCSMGATPLIWAIQIRSKAMVKTLLDYDARLDIPDKRGNTVFNWVVMSFAEIEILEIFIARAKSQARMNLLNHMNYSGRTPLTHCAEKGYYDLAKILITHGALAGHNPMSFNEHFLYPMIPLLTTVEHNSRNVMRLLLNAGASAKIKDSMGMSVLHFAAKGAGLKTLKLLRDARLCCLDISEQDSFGRSPIEIFDVTRLETKPQEDTEARERCREVFVELLRSIKPAGSDHVCTVNGFMPREVDMVSNQEDEDDVFFETRSNFEIDGD